MVRHPGTGKYRRARLFLFTLGYSRKSVRLLTFASSTRRWCELHEESFRRLGGAVQVVVLDNLREGVLTPDVYDPALNPLYRDVLAHYGVVALPCRVGDPDRKGKVESAIGHTQAALKGLRFESLDAAQAYLDRWDARWADTRIHGTTKRQVAAIPPRRSAGAAPADHGDLAGSGRAGRHAHRPALRHDPPPRRRAGDPSHSRRPRPRQETRGPGRRRRLCRRPRLRGRRLPLRPSLSRAPSRRTAHTAPGRSSHS